MRKLAVLCLFAAAAGGGFGGYKAVVEHQEIHRFEAIKAVHQTLKDDATRIGDESETYLGGALAQTVANTAQSLIDSNQALIEQHREQEKIGDVFLVASAVLLACGFLLFRKRAKPESASSIPPARSHANENIVAENAIPTSPQQIEVSDQPYRGPIYALVAVGVLVFCMLMVGKIRLLSNSHTIPTPKSAAVTSAKPTPAPQGYWQVDSETNPVTGALSTTASLKYQGRQNIIIRQNGKKLDCYITTDTFLETIDNMESRVSTVQYKFDDGKTIRQGWTISADNTALFYPGSCAPLMAKIRKAKSLYFEYRPADEIPQTITFDVTAFPNAFKTDATVPSLREPRPAPAE
jgi:hypothetical protein